MTFEKNAFSTTFARIELDLCALPGRTGIEIKGLLGVIIHHKG